MTATLTPADYTVRAATTQHLGVLARLSNIAGRQREGVTLQQVLDELHERAIMNQSASWQGYFDLVTAIDDARSGALATFTGVKLIKALGVLAALADDEDWTDLATVKLTRRAAVESLHELALRS